MYRTVNDFLTEWSNASAGTIRVLESITDDKLNQAIVEGHNSLGWLGWHITTAISYFTGLVGLDVQVEGDPKTVPNKAADILEAYKKVSEAVKIAVEEKLTDEKLLEEVDNHGKMTPRGAILRTLIDHQTHHRGQMTVL